MCAMSSEQTPPADRSEPAAADSPFLENLLLFPRMLRQAGLTISLDQTLNFARALRLIDLANREQVFHAARALLVTRAETLRLFAAIFNQFWRLHRANEAPRGQRAPVAPRHDLQGRKQFTVATYMAYKARRFDPEVEVQDRAATYSSLEVLQRKHFSEMTPDELAGVRRLIQGMRWKASLRETRRLVPASRGDVIDLRKALRQVAKTGCVPPRPAWRARKIKPRPIVLLADVSGSMEQVSRLVLLFFFSLSQSLKDIECFTFGTRLARITPHLKIRNVDRAIAEASREIPDWAGGTRIGESLRAFNRQWSRRVLRRGAVVLIVSDGWERGDVGLLRSEMQHLGRRCHRLIWLNPLLGKQGYQPKVEGMAAALTHVDDFLPVHNLHSFEQLSRHLAALRK